MALTGAGASTASGIPDFRSPAGWWAQFDPQVTSSLQAFRRDPERVWKFHGPRLRLLAETRPSPVHEALAQLEQAGLPTIAKAHGAAVAILNLGPTSFDAQADLRVDGDAATALAALATLVCT